MHLSVQENGSVDHFIADKVVEKLTVYFKNDGSKKKFFDSRRD